MQTANGVSAAARTWLPHVRVGSVEVHDVEAIVMAPGAAASSLLGMSFLSKLRRFGISNGELLLEQ
jgi:aspartyl protease family protein